MAFKVQVGPPQISIHQGQTILISELDGQIKRPSERVCISVTRALSATGPSMLMARLPARRRRTRGNVERSLARQRC
jgi:hypothetical protein